MRYDITKLEPGDLLEKREVVKCPKCGRSAIEVADPFFLDRRVCLHKFDRVEVHGCIHITANDRCELDTDRPNATQEVATK